jgi:pimeloyl-ACP methyl ester carboxylesterase
MRLILKLVLAVVILILAALATLRGVATLRETAVLEESIPPEGSIVPTSEGNFYVEEAGPEDGIPVMLIHGSVGWSRLWADITPALAEAGYHTISIDLPPMGYSDRDPAADYSRTRQADRILALIEAMQIKPVIVAHSFGAGPAAEAALKDPDAVSGMVLVSAAMTLGGHERAGELPLPLRPRVVREWLMSATATNLLVTRRMVSLFLYRKDMLTDAQIAILQQPATLEGSTRALAEWLPFLMVPPTDALSTRPESFATMTLPVALIWGDKDTTTPLTQGDTLQQAIPGATLAILPDVGHIPQIEDPEAFRAALVAALASVTTRP